MAPLLSFAHLVILPMVMQLSVAQGTSNASLDPAAVAQIQSLILDKVGFLVMGGVFLALGMIVVLLALSKFEVRDGVLLLFGVMSLLWGLRFLSHAPVIPLMVGWEPDVWARFTRFLAYLSAPPAFGFAWCLLGPGWKHSLRIITWVSIGFAVVACSVLVVVPNPDLLLHVFNVMMLLCLAVVVVNVLRPEVRSHPEMKKLIGGGLASLVFIVLENLNSLGAVHFAFSVEWVGALLLYGTLGYVSASHIIVAERQLATLRQELETARQIQASILPQSTPAISCLVVATRYLPMTEVAGDFFDFAPIDSNRCGFLIADVSGHGVPAALVAAMVKVAFQTQVGHRHGPARVLTGMNEILGHRFSAQFVTAGYACIDTEAGTIRYAGAGHPPLYLKSCHGGIEEIAPNGLILGPFPEARYESAERNLEPGDRILMYTDGIIEAFNAEEEEFGDQRLKDLLSNCGDLSAESFADKILDEVRLWSGVKPDDTLEDDLTLIVIDVQSS